MAAALALAGCAPHSTIAAGGPLTVPQPHGYAQEVEVGGTITDAFDELRLSGHRDATVISVVPVFNRAGIRVLGVDTSGSPRSMAVPEQMYSVWPPSDPDLGGTRAAQGTVVRPAAGSYFPPQVLMGMRVLRAGHYLRKGFWVTYRVGGTTYRDFIPAELTICTPTFMRGNTCPFLGGGPKS